jgi:hypothetical protein
MTAPHTYVTTTIPYVNARPHIGFALELVQADVLARYRRGRWPPSTAPTRCAGGCCARCRGWATPTSPSGG